MSQTKRKGNRITEMIPEKPQRYRTYTEVDLALQARPGLWAKQVPVVRDDDEWQEGEPWY